MPKKKRDFVNFEDLEEASEEVSRLAKGENVDVALIGGYALQIYGSPRLTGDIDIIASEDIMELPAGPPLSFGGVQTESSKGVPVDLILRSDDKASLYEEALENAVKKRGLPIKIATPEYIAAMKHMSKRGRDYADLEWLLFELKINKKKTRAIIGRHFGEDDAEDFDQLIEDLKLQQNPIRRRRKRA